MMGTKVSGEFIAFIFTFHFYPEDAGELFLRNFSIHVLEYIVSYLRMPQYESPPPSKLHVLCKIYFELPFKPFLTV
jgi:hypothetical protein